MAGSCVFCLDLTKKEGVCYSSILANAALVKKPGPLFSWSPEYLYLSTFTYPKI